MATAASPHRTSTSAGTTDTPPPTHDSEGPLSDLRLADYELCLRHHEARIILVEAISDADTVTEAEAIAGPVASAEPTTEPAGEEQHR